MPTMESINFNAMTYMFKGEPGTRKSTHALSFPGPQYWFSWDRKMEGIALPMRKWGIDPKTISFDSYEDWSTARTKLEQLRVNCPFKTVIFDSVTSMADMTLRQTMRLKYGQKRNSGTTAGKLIAGIAVNEIEDYNAESSALNELLAGAKDLVDYHKINVIFIAHVVKAEYRDTTKKTTHISRQIVTASKNTAAKFPAYCNEVYHFNIKQGFVEGAGGDYSVLTEHTGDDFARTCLGLDSEIILKDKPLYDTWIKPAIAKLTTPVPTTAKF